MIAQLLLLHSSISKRERSYPPPSMTCGSAKSTPVGTECIELVVAGKPGNPQVGVAGPPVDGITDNRRAANHGTAGSIPPQDRSRPGIQSKHVIRSRRATHRT